MRWERGFPEEIKVFTFGSVEAKEVLIFVRGNLAGVGALDSLPEDHQQRSKWYPI